MRKDILIAQNKNDQTEPEKKESNLRLLANIDGRWESSREEGADATKKPLVDYDEWRTSDGGLYTEERTRSMMEGEMSDDSVTRWASWEK